MFQAQFVHQPPSKWPALPSASAQCPDPEETYESHELVVFRFRRGCLLTGGASPARDLLNADDPWLIYDYDADPWAIWACTDYGSNYRLMGCWNDLSHNVRFRELTDARSDTS